MRCKRSFQVAYPGLAFPYRGRQFLNDELARGGFRVDPLDDRQTLPGDRLQPGDLSLMIGDLSRQFLQPLSVNRRLGVHCLDHGQSLVEGFFEAHRRGLRSPRGRRSPGIRCPSNAH